MTGPPTAHIPHQLQPSHSHPHLHHSHPHPHPHPHPHHSQHSEVKPAGRGTVVLSSVSSDAHTWNLVYLQLLLEELGWHVANLGACTPDQVIVDACLRHGPDLVVISTVNGHGHIDGVRLAGVLREQPELLGVPTIIGGKLGVAGEVGTTRVHALLDAGFDAVFQDDADLRSFTSYVTALGESRCAVAP